MNWHTLSAQEVGATLKTDLKKGLSPQEAEKRLIEHGPNLIKEKKKVSPIIIFLEQFNDFMIWVLIAAALISGFLLKEMVDAIVIGIILLLNAILGFVQTYRAEKALEALKALAAPTATVIRHAEQQINSEEVVVGDIIILEAGDKIPADCRLLEAASLQTGEAALTGESMPTGKITDALSETNLPVSEMKNIAFVGTAVTRGWAKAVVVASGRDTQMGKIAALIETDEEPTPLQKELKQVGLRIAIAIIFIALFVFGIGTLKGGEVAFMFLTAVALAVAAIPEGLPAIVTITLAIGVQYMAAENAIVRRLHAVETLGSTDYIVSDKTGTLTLNEMAVKRLYLDGTLFSVKDSELVGAESKTTSESLDKLMQCAVLANDSRRQTEDGGYIGEPTELALVQAGDKFGYKKSELDEHYKRVDELPFESERKKMTTVNSFDNRFVAFTKGAVEVLISQSDSVFENGETRPLTEEEKKRLIDISNQEAAAGYRMLGFAFRQFNSRPKMEELEKKMTFIGMTGLLDPPRPEVSAAIKMAREAGIEIAMVTGDHLLTATKIAEEVGLLDNVAEAFRPPHGDPKVSATKETLTGMQLQNMTSHELAAKVEHITVFARVDPVHKVKIVEALKEKGYVVAVTGDGVNDAPALKKADIGVAMGITGTDVSKEASDMILSDDNFATIVKAIRQGRVIYDNLRKFISFLLSANVSEVLTIFLGILLFPANVSLLVPIQILWINLVTDAFPALALGVDPPEPGLMKRGPRKKEEGILNFKQAVRITTEGVFLTAAALSVFCLAFITFKTGELKAATMVFTTLVLIQLIHAFNYRGGKSIFNIESFKNKYLIWAFAGSFALQLIVVYVPFLQPLFNTTALGISDWGLILAATFIAEVLIDRFKTTVFAK